MSEELKVNLLDPFFEGDPKRAHRRRLMRTLLIALVLGVSVAVTAASGVIAPTESISDIGPLAIISRVGRLVVAADKGLDGEAQNDRINILLLGMGGEGHYGPYLTDTIMLLSIQPSTNDASLISIPRDLLVDIPGYDWRKVNHAHALAEADNPGTGGTVAREVIGKTFDQDIPYYVRIDFKGFIKLVDDLGGVKVTVDRSFTDRQYPAPNDEYQSVSFSAGEQNMSGVTALRFARSRHGSNGEGSDFARSRRQQKILVALKNKILSPSTLANPKKLSSILDAMRTNVSTNLEIWEMLHLAELAKDFDTSNIQHLVIDSSPGGLLTNANIEGVFALVPHDDDYGLLARAVENVFSDVDTSDTGGDDAGLRVAETVRLEIQNGTRITGLAAQTSDFLEEQGYTVVGIGNAQNRNYERSVIYDYSDGQYSEALRRLRDELQAEVSVTLPGWITSPDVPSQISINAPQPRYKSVDFLIILGNNSANQLSTN